MEAASHASRIAFAECVRACAAPDAPVASHLAWCLGEGVGGLRCPPAAAVARAIHMAELQPHLPLLAERFFGYSRAAAAAAPAAEEAAGRGARRGSSGEEQEEAGQRLIAASAAAAQAGMNRPRKLDLAGAGPAAWRARRARGVPRSHWAGGAAGNARNGVGQGGQMGTQHATSTCTPPRRMLGEAARARAWGPDCAGVASLVESSCLQRVEGGSARRPPPGLAPDVGSVCEWVGGLHSLTSHQC